MNELPRDAHRVGCSRHVSTMLLELLRQIHTFERGDDLFTRASKRQMKRELGMRGGGAVLALLEDLQPEVREDHNSGEDVPELTNVPRPVVRPQHREDLRGEALNRPWRMVSGEKALDE